jgi:hypothetical protein
MALAASDFKKLEAAEKNLAPNRKSSGEERKHSPENYKTNESRLKRPSNGYHLGAPASRRHE